MGEFRIVPWLGLLSNLAHGIKYAALLPLKASFSLPFDQANTLQPFGFTTTPPLQPIPKYLNLVYIFQYVYFMSLKRLF
jgi:hypothetical protein